MFDKNPARHQMILSVLVFLGGSLLLLGNTLYWPCHPGSWRGLCDPSLDVLFVNEINVGVFIAAVTLMLLLEVKLLKYPMSNFAWTSYWIILYFLFIAKIRTDSTFPSYHYTWVNFNRNLVTIAVTPLSLLSYWLILRPQDIKQKYRKLTLVCLFALLIIIIIILLFAVLALDLRIRHSFEWKEIIRIAPVAILAGTLLSLGAEYAYMQVDKQRSGQNDEKDEGDQPDNGTDLEGDSA